MPAKQKKGIAVRASDKAIKTKEDEKESLAFKIINAEQTKIIYGCDDVDDVQKKVAEILEITDDAVDPKAGATLDYFTSGVWWAKENNFTAEQISAFFTVLHTLLDNIKDKHLTVIENVCHFKKMFAGVAMEHCELSGGLECFDLKQATLISDYIYVSLFQHYKMYEFIFGATQAEEIIGTDLLVEVPPPADLPWPPPLEEAVTGEIHQLYIATPPPSPTKSFLTEEEAQLEEEKANEERQAEGEKIADLMAQLTTEQVTSAMDQVFEEMLAGVKLDIAAKLRQKENDFINRINKIHRVPSATKK